MPSHRRLQRCLSSFRRLFSFLDVGGGGRVRRGPRRATAETDRRQSRPPRHNAPPRTPTPAPRNTVQLSTTLPLVPSESGEPEVGAFRFGVPAPEKGISCEAFTIRRVLGCFPEDCLRYRPRLGARPAAVVAVAQQARRPPLPSALHSFTARERVPEPPARKPADGRRAGEAHPADSRSPPPPDPDVVVPVMPLVHSARLYMRLVLLRSFSEITTPSGGRRPHCRSLSCVCGVMQINQSSSVPCLVQNELNRLCKRLYNVLEATQLNSMYTV